MKKLMVIVLAGCVLAMSQGVRTVAADQGWTPLEELAGTYAVTVQESLAVSLANTPSHPPAPCSPDSTVARLSVLGVGSAAFDEAGNFCVTFTVTLTDLPADASPTASFVVHNLGRITSYDPRTG